MYLICDECEKLHRFSPLSQPGQVAKCARCGATMYRFQPYANRVLFSLQLSALLLLLLANLFPLLEIEAAGQLHSGYLYSLAYQFWQHGTPILAMVVLLTSLFFPVVTALLLLYLLRPGVDRRNDFEHTLYIWHEKLSVWSMLPVMVLAVLLAIVKLKDMSEIIIGIGYIALFAYLFISVLVRYLFDKTLLWPPDQYVDSGGHIHYHSQTVKHNSLQTTWALIATAIILLIPANLYPIMTVYQLGQGVPDTIFSGVVHLIEGGMWPLAMVVFFASIVVPVLKLLVLSYLAIAVQRCDNEDQHRKFRYYRFTEAVGAWSMVDIYLIGLLITLVQLDFLATIEVEPAATWFGLAVVVTMMAAHSFDTAKFWKIDSHG